MSQQKQILNYPTLSRSWSLVAGVLLLAIVACAFARGASALSLMSSEQVAEQLAGKQPVTLAVIESPELTAHVLDNLLRSIVLSANVDLQSIQNQKRGLDLGISRGFSGSQAGKHLMGLSAASFANGPGRK